MKDRDGRKYFKDIRFQSTYKSYYEEQKSKMMFLVWVVDLIAC